METEHISPPTDASMIEDSGHTAERFKALDALQTNVDSGWSFQIGTFLQLWGDECANPLGLLETFGRGSHSSMSRPESFSPLFSLSNHGQDTRETIWMRMIWNITTCCEAPPPARRSFNHGSVAFFSSERTSISRRSSPFKPQIVFSKSPATSCDRRRGFVCVIFSPSGF